MCKFIRPQTLFGTKFESYLQQAKVRSGDSLSKDERIEEIRKKYGLEEHE